MVAIVFDFDHTLGIDHRLEERVLLSLARKYCRIIPSKAECLKALQEFRSGKKSLSTMLLDSFKRWNFKGDMAKMKDCVASYQEECLKKVTPWVTPMEGAKEVLAVLHKQRVRVGIFSNGWSKLQRAKARCIGFKGPVLASEELGKWKPNPEAFWLALERFRFPTERTAYVGDLPEMDVVGSKKAGLCAVWANLENKEYPKGIVLPDFVIKSLEDLPKILRRINDCF